METKTKSSSFENHNPETDSRTVSLSKLHRFHNHPFQVDKNLELFELMESIRAEGVLVPLIVRSNPYGEGYEILSGHRRREAAQWAGLKKVPVVVREPNQRDQIRISLDRVRKYIPESYTPAQQIKLIETLLQAWAKESKGKRRMRS